MPLIYVTGIEAAGKSTTCRELKARGYEAYDIDEGIAHYYSIVSGKEASMTDPEVASTEEWHYQHVYMMDRAKVKDYQRKSKDKLIFLCGTTRSDWRVIDLFDQVFYLYLDEATLEQRLGLRRPGEFGHSDYERSTILKWRQSTQDAYHQYGAAMIDATQPNPDIVSQILVKIK